MGGSAAEVQQLRSLLEGRFGRAIVQPHSREQASGFSLGVPLLDRLLPHGVPRGVLTLWRGEATAGRTAALRALVVRACTGGARVALVDATRTLDAGFGCTPTGPLLGLWVVRPPGAEQVREGAWAAEMLLRAGVFDLVILDGCVPEPAQLHRLRLLAKEADAALLISAESTSAGARVDVQLEFRRLRGGRGLQVGGRFRRWVRVRAVKAGAGAFLNLESEVEVVHEPANRLHSGAPAPDRRPGRG
ncbi:hypothetical protein BH24GEM3_BH24GEM3_17420 [soil metagenome]